MCLLWRNRGANQGYMGHHQNESGHHYILICSNCNKPTYFPYNEDVQYPGTSYRDRVQHIDDEGIAALYEEARNCISVGACTAAVLCCRKILMHAAVLQKAPKNKKLIDYVQSILQTTISYRLMRRGGSITFARRVTAQTTEFC